MLAYVCVLFISVYVLQMYMNECTYVCAFFILDTILESRDHPVRFLAKAYRFYALDPSHRVSEEKEIERRREGGREGEKKGGREGGREGRKERKREGENFYS